MKRRIFIDMDGVLCDFTDAVARLCGTTRTELEDQWPVGIYHNGVVLGLSDSEMWKRIDSVGEDFWSGLEKLPWADELLDLCQGYTKSIYILTKSARSPYCMSGKLKWIYSNIDPKFRRFIVVGSTKKLLARPGHVLIDDMDDHVDQWTKEGGEGIVFPQKWNRGREFYDNPMEVISSRLKKFFDGTDEGNANEDQRAKTRT